MPQPPLSPDECMLRSLSSFLTEEMIENEIRPLVEQKAALSLRAMDWLVVNYAKKHNIVCRTLKGELFNIHQNYKTALSHRRRSNFDPFRRKARLTIHGKRPLVTTVGQLNFLQWMHVNGVWQYAVDHAEEINLDMNRMASENKKERKSLQASGVVKRRKELSKAPSSKCFVYKVRTKVSFGSGREAD
jgi:hypothetical protein